MSGDHNRYLEAARSDLDGLKQEFDKVRERLELDGDTSNARSELLDTAWSDLRSQWRKLQASGAAASAETRDAYEEARTHLRKVLDAYHRG